jgi:hypothetical protein
MCKKFLLSLLVLPVIALSQPPRKKPPALPAPVVRGDAIIDTLQTRTDTTQMRFAVWTDGDYFNYQSYLSRVNGYVVRIIKAGKFVQQEPQFKYFDWQWKELRPDQLEFNLAKPVKWTQ